MTRRTHIVIATLTLAAIAGTTALIAAGPLNPPSGAVTSTGKTLSEIEPRVAISATTTPGDNDSMFKITQPGSYYLTGNIAGALGKHGIEIASSGVTIDLNGFTVSGVSGSLDGISATGIGMVNVTIRNGAVLGWGGHGIDGVTASVVNMRVENVLSALNGGVGIRSGSGSTVSHCSAYDNNGIGIAMGAGSTASTCTSRDNGQHGFLLNIGSTITNCAANSNGMSGIASNGGVSVDRCAAASNTINGFDLNNGSSIISSVARANVLDGIRGTFQCVIIGNACSSNGSGGDGAGIHVVGTDNRIEGNNCSSADRGIDVDVGGNFIVRNTCRSNTVNWDIFAGNAVAPIVQAGTNAGAINGNTYTGALGSTDPNANFTY